MQNLAKQYTSLSPERRTLLKLFFEQEGISIAQIPIQQHPRELQKFPLSFGQQRLWFPVQMQLGNPAYNMAYAVHLTGQLNVKMVQQVLNELVQRHESLRTIFPEEHGLPYQLPLPTLTCNLLLVDLQNLSLDLKEDIVRQLANEEHQQLFDLTCGPLLRTTLLRYSETEYLFLLTIHHIVADGWSLAIFIKEFVEIYSAYVEQRPAALPVLPVRYIDYSLWQHNWLADELLEEQLSYWREQLEGIPPLLKLPTDRPRPAIQTHHGSIQTCNLPTSLMTPLKALCAQENITLFMTLLAAFQTLLHLYTGEDDIVVGTDVANRNRSETEGLIGFFSNQLVLRTSFASNPTFRQLLHRVRDVVIGAYSHQDVPFEKLVKALNPKRNLSYTPLFQIKIGFLSIPLLPQAFCGLTLKQLQIGGTAKFDIELSLWEESEGVCGFFEYNTDLFDASTISAMNDLFVAILQQMVGDLEQPVLDVALKDQQARFAPPAETVPTFSNDQFVFRW